MLYTNEDFREVERLGRAIATYQKASGQTTAFAALKTCREMAFALQKETAKITPKKNLYLELPGKLGWDSSTRKHKKTGKEGSAKARLQIVEAGGVDKLMQKRMISWRYAASGWLPAIKGLRRKGTADTISGKNGSISAVINPNTGRVRITMTNKAANIETVNNKHSVVKKAVDRVMRNFAPYIKRKLGEDALKAFWSKGSGGL